MEYSDLPSCTSQLQVVFFNGALQERKHLVCTQTSITPQPTGDDVQGRCVGPFQSTLLEVGAVRGMVV